ncbi:hypothetical protein PFISCL1PPCAC_24374, partial [Pristionchus fissidentatus]
MASSSPIVLLLVASLLLHTITAQNYDDFSRDARAPKLIRFGRAGPKLVRFGKRSDPNLNAEEYDNILNDMYYGSADKRGGPKV